MRLQAWRRQEPHSRAAHVSEGCFVHLAVRTWLASLSEVNRAPGQFGGPGHPWLSQILFVSRLKSPIPPGHSSVLRIWAQHRFRKWTFMVLLYISSPPVSVWERSLKGYFADMVYHLTVVNKKSRYVLVIKANLYPFNKKQGFCCCLTLLHCCLWPFAALSLYKLWLQPADLAGLAIPLPVQYCSPEIRTQQSSSECDLSFQLLLGEHTCKWLNFLLAQCKFFSVGISVRCCFAAWS